MTEPQRQQQHINWPLIDNAVREYGRLHAFRSGGGLRVLRIDAQKTDGGKDNIGYGEAPVTEQAFMYLGKGLERSAGASREGSAYKAFYGTLVPHYLTGTSGCSGTLDTHVCRGSAFDVVWDTETGEFVAEAPYRSREGAVPREVIDRVINGESVCEDYTDDRGVQFRINPSRFANGTPGATVTIIDKPEGVSHFDAYEPLVEQTGRGSTVLGAIQQIFPDFPNPAIEPEYLDQQQGGTA